MRHETIRTHKKLNEKKHEMLKWNAHRLWNEIFSKETNLCDDSSVNPFKVDSMWSTWCKTSEAIEKLNSCMKKFLFLWSFFLHRCDLFFHSLGGFISKTPFLFGRWKKDAVNIKRRNLWISFFLSYWKLNFSSHLRSRMSPGYACFELLRGLFFITMFSIYDGE